MNIIKSLAKLDWLTEYESKIARFSHRCTPAAHRSRCLFMYHACPSHFFAVGVRTLRSNFAKDEAALHSNCAELRRPQHDFQPLRDFRALKSTNRKYFDGAPNLEITQAPRNRLQKMLDILTLQFYFFL